MTTFKEELDWICRPLTPPIPVEEFNECLESLREFVISEAYTPSEVDAIIAKNRNIRRDGARSHSFNVARGVVPNIAKRTTEKKPGMRDRMKKFLSGRKAKKAAAGKSSIEKRLKEFRVWLRTVGRDYPKAASTLQDIEGQTLEYTETKGPEFVLQRVQAWAQKKMLPSFQKRMDYLKDEAFTARAYAHNLRNILGIK